MTQRQNGSICAEEYVVKRGDSFYLIAHKLGVPLRDLLAANRDIHPARLMVGDVLCIPREEDDRPQGSAPAVPDSTGGNTSAGSGSSTNGSSVSGSGETGGSAAPGTPSVPDSSAPGASVAPVVPAPAEPAPPVPTPGISCPVEEQVTVRQGETIADIQLQSLLSRNTLQKANPGVDLDALPVGQTLCVPTENTACTLPTTYTLVEGETLESVAMRFNLPLGSLLRTNPCLAPQDFEEGVTVILPR